MRGLDGAVVLVTGGGGAIGAAISERLADEGCHVAIIDIDSDSAERTATGIRRSGGTATAVIADITRHDLVRRAVQQVEEQAGPITGVVNNAGWNLYRAFIDTEPELWDRIIDINLRGPINVLHAVLPGMVARGHGRVVTISSESARVGGSGESVFAACTGGMAAFTKAVARELATKGVVLNTVCPGPTEGPMLDQVLADSGMADKLADAYTRATPMRRLARPGDLPGVIAFLLSDDARFITGQVISVSGGLTMAG